MLRNGEPRARRGGCRRGCASLVRGVLSTPLLFFTLIFALGFLAPVSVPAEIVLQEYSVKPGSHPHDVAPGPDGRVWYTAQHAAALGWLDPDTGRTGHIPLGRGSRPHGVIVGPDGDVWVTDSGLNAIVRVDKITERVTRYPLPASARGANLNTAAFDRHGILWFTGQGGIYGRLDPAIGRMEVFDAPKGRGPYGIDSTPDGDIYYVSLAGSYLGRIDPGTGKVTVLEPPTSRQGTRRVWADAKGILWITGWHSGNLLRYDPAVDRWKEIPLPGTGARPYAVYVDERDKVWVSDFESNSIFLYDPMVGRFTRFTLPSRGAQVRQMLGRQGELWGAESGTDKLVVIRY